MIDKMQNNNLNNPEKNQKLDLFLRQKETLDLFLERGAITQAQYDKSFGDLKEKMGIEEILKAGDV